ncbi:MAG: hypothetical protein HRT57_00980 [Crocinitomicaceae bacterium]|nr:hypothetical protein [Crocinitomicaceae bacterium]
MKKVLLQVCLILSVSFVSNGQQTANYINNWHFGTGSGISFNSGAPVNIASNIIANEAMSTFSDGLGITLFYSAANQTWDATNTAMPNGTTSGDISSSSGTTICKVPGKCNQYYIFYIEHGAGGAGVNNSLHYYLIDMNLPGNGTVLAPLGDIVAGQKDLLVFNTDNLGEKTFIVQQGNTENYWLIVRSNTVENFYSFEVTSAGVNTTFVPSVVSLVPYPPAPAPFSGNVSTFLGWMAINRDRNIIAEANGIYTDARAYDFDNVTGVLSNQEIIMTGLNYIWDIPYGLAFSESGNSLYIGWSRSPGLKLFSSFDVTGGVGNIAATRTDHDISIQLPGSVDVPRGVVLGRDGKIYFGWGGTTPFNTQIGVINDPDNLVTPNIIANGHTVTNESELGMPNIAYYYHPNNFIDTLAGQDRSICPSDQAIIGAAGYDSIWSTYSWDPAAMVLNTSSATTQTIALTVDQEFLLHTIHACGDTIKSDTVMVLVTCLLVELVDFDVYKNDKNVEVTWSTYSETNSSHFDVEHSSDAVNFEAIGTLTSTGNSQKKNDYKFIDTRPESGVNYYRLKQVDLVGTSEYSDIRSVLFESDCGLQLYPNPASNLIVLNPNGIEIAEITIRSNSGKFTGLNFCLSVGVITI